MAFFLGICFNDSLLLDFRFTELEISVPDIGIVGLHAENLGIVSVSVDGDPTEFEYYPRHQHMESERSFKAALSSSSVADAAGSIYLSSIEKELVPNLLINCCKAFKNGSEQQDQPVVENGVQPAGEDKQVVAVSHFKMSVFYMMENMYLNAQCSALVLVFNKLFFTPYVFWLANVVVMKYVYT